VLEFAGFFVFAGFVLAIDQQWIGGAVSPSGFAFQFLLALGFIVKPLREIGEQLAKYHETKGAVAKCLDLLHLSLSDVSHSFSPAGVAPAQLNLGIGVDFRRIQFCWPGGERSFDFHHSNLHSTQAGSYLTSSSNALRISSGQAIAVIGPSGSGKSTLLKILSGLARPDEWECSSAWEDFAAATALVPQQPYLFASSIRENISYGRSNCPDETIWSALDMMEARGLVMGLPEGLGTPVSSLASTLSGGQTQRVVIARALLRDRPVLLLDEATSALDPSTEGAVLQSVIATVRRSGHALMAVTHRLQWLSLFDEIWFVEDGRISMHGPMDRLMENERFRQFCQVSQ
jgi:ABC-type multidrug transport system fused ATPase/permease subunit